jgi:large conductance mechanosensitive channel
MNLNMIDLNNRPVGALKAFIHDFKEFAVKGNAVDLAVGVVIGAAFGSIVNSLVKDVIMPPIGLLTGGVDFSDKVIKLKDAVVDSAGKITAPEVDLRYGMFLNQVINFVIVAFSIFMVIKMMSMLHRKEAAAPTPAEPPMTTDQKLLGEIRDILKESRPHQQ